MAVGGDVYFFLWFKAPTSHHSTSKDLKQNTAMSSQGIDFISPTTQGKMRNTSSRLEGEVTISVHRRGGSWLGSFHSWKAVPGRLHHGPHWYLLPEGRHCGLCDLRGPLMTPGARGCCPGQGQACPRPHITEGNTSWLKTEHFQLQ